MIEFLKSDLPGMLWPPIPTDHGARLLAMLSYLEASQWWSPEQLRQQQLRQAAALLAHARRFSPYIADRLAGCAIGPQLDENNWRELPLLTRADIQEAGESLFCTRLLPGHGTTFSTTTSGSTGQPVTTRGSGLSQFFWNLLTLRDHCWHRAGVDGMHGVIRVLDEPAPAGVVYPDWGVPFNLLFATGPSAAFSITEPAARQLAWLDSINPMYLITYPSNLKALLDALDSAVVSLANLRQVRTIGETLPAGLADECRSRLGVPLVDLYSSQEVGYIALQCPTGDCYHVQAENLLVEVLDDDGNPCQPGRIGQIVVTALHNFATPLIRYAIGDYAEVAEPCRCGRGLPALRRILGRRRNLMALPNGDRIWPVFGTRKFRDEVPAVRQFQIVQKEVDRLEIRLVAARPLGAVDEERLRQMVVRAVGWPVRTEFSYVAGFDCPAGKFEEFRSEV